jgi:hypothetical protein
LKIVKIALRQTLTPPAPPPHEKNLGPMYDVSVHVRGTDFFLLSGSKTLFNSTVCENVFDYSEIESIVETDVIQLLRISLAIQAIPKIIICLLAGSWSDRFRCRKWLMILANSGFVILPIIQLILANVTVANADFLLLEALQVSISSSEVSIISTILLRHQKNREIAAP